MDKELANVALNVAGARSMQTYALAARLISLSIRARIVLRM
jgi:hypothetical protein